MERIRLASHKWKGGLGDLVVWQRRETFLCLAEGREMFYISHRACIITRPSARHQTVPLQMRNVNKKKSIPSGVKLLSVPSQACKSSMSQPFFKVLALRVSPHNRYHNTLNLEYPIMYGLTWVNATLQTPIKMRTEIHGKTTQIAKFEWQAKMVFGSLARCGQKFQYFVSNVVLMCQMIKKKRQANGNFSPFSGQIGISNMPQFVHNIQKTNKIRMNTIQSLMIL